MSFRNIAGAFPLEKGDNPETNIKSLTFISMSQLSQAAQCAHADFVTCLYKFLMVTASSSMNFNVNAIGYSINF